MVKVSIIMPVYNGYSFLEKSVNSVSKQTLKDIELVCVDDGSTDDSLNLLYELNKKFGFIKIITQKNQGSGIARNNGIKNAKGEYIAFLDADDEFLDSNALKMMYSASDINNADIITANLQMVDEEDNIVNNFFYSNNDYLFISENDVISPEMYGLPLSFYKSIFKREFLIKNDIYFPDLKRGQDPPFLAKVLTSTSEIPTVPVDLYGHHFKSGGGAESKVNTYEKKHDYISHFKVTFDILEKKGYFDLVDRYKKKLFIYLNNNFDDTSLNGFNIVNDVFGSDDAYFEGFENRIMEFRINQLINHLDVATDEYFFKKVKNSLLSYDIWNNDLLSLHLLKKCFLICSSDSFYDYKRNMLIFDDDGGDDLLNSKDCTEMYGGIDLGNFSKYMTARIDLKNFGSSTNNIEILENSDSAASIFNPKWFTNRLGIGTQIQSMKGFIHLKIKCINDGKLEIILRGVDSRNKSGQRVPIFINYTDFKINNELIIEEPIVVWHDEPFIFNKKVKNNDVVNIIVKWANVN